MTDALIPAQGASPWKRMVTILAASSLIAGLSSATFSQQIVSSPSRAAIVADVQTAVRGASRDLDILVDPDLTLAIAADAQLFVGNFCFDQAGGSPKNICDASFSDPAILKGVVSDYLHDLSSRPATVETVSSRLARLLGSEIEGTGWPGVVANDIGTVALAETLRGSDIAVATATGFQRIGPSRRLLLLRPGRVSLIATFEDGRTIRSSMTISALKVVAWEGQASQDNSTLGSIGVPPDIYCEQTATSEKPPPLTPFNWGRASFAEPAATRAAHRAPAAFQSALDIAVVDGTGDCGPECLNGIAIAFARAVAAWRAGCQTCDPGALAVVRVGKRVWIDRQAVFALRKFIASRDSLAQFEMRGLFASPSLLVPGRVIAPYDQVDNDADLVEALCRIDDQAIPWVKASQGFLCPGALIEAMPLRPKLSILGELTECGAGAIACGRPGGDVQITTASYSFQVPTPAGSVRLGSSTSLFDIRPVLLHEVGHWFGLPHPSEVGVEVEDVMAGVFQPGRECVSAASLTMLSNAADNRWPYRAQAKQGLLAPSSLRQ